MIKMNATEARNNIGKLWDAAAEEPVTIESAGKPIAVVLSPDTYGRLTAQRAPRQAGCGRHLLSGAGIDINKLLETPLDAEFSDYLPS
jgi:prevent-host-death family protein